MSIEPRHSIQAETALKSAIESASASQVTPEEWWKAVKSPEVQAVIAAVRKAFQELLRPLQKDSPEFRKLLQDFNAAIAAAKAKTEAELASRHLPMPKNIEGWESLAYAVGIPPKDIPDQTLRDIMMCAVGWSDRERAKAKYLAEAFSSVAPTLLPTPLSSQPPSAGEAGSNGSPKTVRPKRSTVRGEASTKLESLLPTHHEYDNGHCGNWEPIGCNELARLAGVAPSTASVFFDKVFGRSADATGYDRYRALCYNNHPELVRKLKRLNDEYSPEKQYGVTPPGEEDCED